MNHTLVLPEKTSALIESAILALGYQANPHARRLSLGRSETIGLVIPDIANPFFARMADAIQQEAEAAGFEVAISTTRNRLGRELAALTRLGNERAEGVLFVTNRADDGSVARALGATRHVVVLDEDVPGVDAPKLFADNLAGGALAARHFLAHGHRKFAILGGPLGLLSSQERHGSFCTTIVQGGGEMLFEDFSDYTAFEGRAAAHRMLDAPIRPTAVFATSDETALGLLDALRERGLSVPDALSVIAYDDIGPWHLLSPPLTAIRQPVEELGRRGVQMLLASLRGEPVAAVGRVSVELVERGTVGPPPTQKLKD